jgi:hypothetical protein
LPPGHAPLERGTRRAGGARCPRCQSRFDRHKTVVKGVSSSIGVFVALVLREV